ncbi:hypothetical protein SAMN02745157_4918 [Kaistia soli DSM 19436]|uniref:Uncharacterized protein n=1 Tax=Kaistia soli DSM 19436 TaxID=1122133 RepID=A0A1M5N6P1_9HYPH|nr:hypothetical protein [Kaistia soli]SHG84673.1 hypothetical protein SAMN02745157_4918 [Kaistia soli DSM 19436]
MTNLGNTYVSDAAPRWTVEAIGRLRELAVEGVPAEVIAQAMHRPIGEILGKAAELGLTIEPEPKTH